MPAMENSIRSVFLSAVGRDADQWPAFLDEACGGDAELRARVERLLYSHKAMGSIHGGGTDPAATAERPISEFPGTLIGPYKLLEQIGEGGFGVVFMAEQSSPMRRKVALKVLKPGMDSRQVVARFEAERQALALMDHNNIAKVFDGGETAGGRPYFVMELVRGIPITDFCDRNRQGVRGRLGLFAQVCRAVQHAHQKGVIHRDLKPTNVLVTLHDGTPVPKVIDFGIAKAAGQPLTEKTLFTNFAQMIGTPLYMSPEQAQMSGLDVDTRSDIYSLGVLLYELLTGATPFDKERMRTVGFDEIRRIIREEQPAKPSARMSTLGPASATVSANRGSEPRKLSALFRGELDWIVMKALEKDRNRRYESASAFAADVERYLNDEPVQACPPSVGYRFRKFARRNQGPVLAATAIFLALLGGIVGTSVGLVRAGQARQREAQRAEGERLAKGELNQTLYDERVEGYFRRIALAQGELSLNNLKRALELLEDCPEELRAWEWDYLMRLCRVEPLIIPDKTEVNSIAFSPKGDSLASAGGDGSIKIWNSGTGELIRVITKAHGDSVYSIAFHPDGEHLASVGWDRQVKEREEGKTVKVWNWKTGLKVFERPCDAVHTFGTAYAAAFSPPDGRQLAAGSNGDVKVWDWSKRELLHSFPGSDKHRLSVAYSRDGRRLASGSWGGTVQLRDPEAGGGEPLRTFPVTTPHPVSALAFDKGGDRLATASFARRVDVWDTTTGGLVYTLPHSTLVLGVAFSPDSVLLATVGEDKIVRVWDANTRRELLGLRGHTGQCGCVAFSPDGRRLASSSSDGTIRVWDATPLRSGECQEKETFEEHSVEIWCLAVGPDASDGQKVVSGGFGSPSLIWDAKTLRVGAKFTGHTVIDFCVAWHPDGQRIAFAGATGALFTVKVWNARTGEDVFSLPPGPEYFAAAFSPDPDGKYLVTGNAKGDVQVWDANRGQSIRTLGTHKGTIRGVVFSRDGKYLASVSSDGEVKLWDATRLGAAPTALEPPELLHTFPSHVPGPGLNVAFSPDGKRMAIGDKEYTVKIWDVETRRELRTLRGYRGHTHDVYTVAFSPDRGGRWVASAGEDSTVKVWDSHTGELRRTFRGHKGLVTCLAFSPDGRELFSGSRDKTVKVWDMTQLEDRRIAR